MGKLYVRAWYVSTRERIIAAKLLLFLNICKFFLKKIIFAAKMAFLEDKEGNRQNRKTRGIGELGDLEILGVLGVLNGLGSLGELGSLDSIGRQD